MARKPWQVRSHEGTHEIYHSECDQISAKTRGRILAKRIAAALNATNGIATADLHHLKVQPQRKASLWHRILNRLKELTHVRH